MNVQVERLDHLGVIAGIIKDLKLVEFIDERIPSDAREEISCGEAIAAMIINGLGFSDRPLTLTPQFFENKALTSLFREGINAEHFNRFKLGRALDDCHAYGCELLFAEASARICQKESIDTRFNSLDTTAFALTGEYNVDCDEHTIAITHGYSKDHRPDLKQAVIEMMCSHDGGVPIISRTWNGNASDTKIFRERAKKLQESFKAAESPRYLIADSKLYDEKTIQEGLSIIPFITRIPGTLTLEQDTIKAAFSQPLNTWEILNETHRFKTFHVEHYGLKQRWIVVYSEERKHKAKHSVEKMYQKEKEDNEKVLKKLYTEEFSCPNDAKGALKRCVKKLKFHELSEETIEEEKKYESKGRPKSDSPCTTIYRIKAVLKDSQEVREEAIKQSSCFIVGTTIAEKELSDKEVITAYKNQNNTVEKGFRFLKDPLMFTSSLFIKKPERIMGLLMVMTLALLIYSIAQRRLRKVLKELQETLPNQIHKETETPTLRWIFQLLEGIEVVKMRIENITKEVVSGITDLRKRILSYFGSVIKKIYRLDIESALDS